ncbi:hypothetical protein C3L33_03910, partial [Rhododendron williamsianum]
MSLCGVSSVKLCYTSDDIIIRCLVSEVRDATCGADFSVWTADLPQYGQLGHGADNEYNTRNSSVLLAYEAQPCPKAVVSLAGETIVKVACGEHTFAVDSNGLFTRGDVVIMEGIGPLYMWGKVKNKGDEWMYPKPVMDLRLGELNYGSTLFIELWWNDVYYSFCVFSMDHEACRCLVLSGVQVVKKVAVKGVSTCWLVLFRLFTGRSYMKICENKEELKTKLKEVLHEK